MGITTSTSKHAFLPAHAKLAPEHAHTTKTRTRETSAPALRTMTWVFSIVPSLVLALILLVGWYGSTTFGGVNALFLPPPASTFASLWDGLVSGLYLSNTLVTVQESLLGFLLSLLIALPLGYGLVKFRLLAAALHPYLAAGQAIPAIVIAPLFVIWLGYGQLPNVVICMLVVLFPMVINTMLGVQMIDKMFTDAARVEGASGWSLLTYIEFPLALPAILAGVRTGLTLSITGALVAEFVQGGDQGLGSLLLVAKNQLNTPLMFATLAVLVVLALLYYASTWLLSRLAEAIY
jgi:NitT/TauT family transport system permease protein